MAGDNHEKGAPKNFHRTIGRIDFRDPDKSAAKLIELLNKTSAPEVLDAVIKKFEETIAADDNADDNAIFQTEREISNYLYHIGMPQVIPLLIRASEVSKNAVFRCMAMAALAQTGDVSAFDTILRVMREDSNPDFRAYACEYLGKLKDPRAYEPLAAAVNNENPLIQNFAKAAICDLGDPRAIDLIIGLLSDPEAEIHDLALDALNKFGPLAANALITRLPRMEWFRDLGLIAEELAFKLAPESAREQWTAAMADCDGGIGKRAALLVGRFCPDFAVAHYTERLLRAGDYYERQDDRIQAVKALGRMPIAQSVEALINAYDAFHFDPSNHILIRWIVDTLNEMNLLAAYSLERRIKGDDLGQRRAAAELLGDIDSQSAVRLLVEALEADNCLVGRAAASSLERRASRTYGIEEMLVAKLREMPQERQDIILDLFSSELRLRLYALRASPELRLRLYPLRASSENEQRKAAETVAQAQAEAIAKAQMEENEEIAEQSKRLDEIVEALVEKLTEILSLGDTASNVDSNGSDLGSVSMGLRQELRLAQQLEMTLMEKQGVTVESGSTIEDIRERARTINFLVHHEVAHIVQKNRKIAEPRINAGAYPLFDAERVAHYANEVLVDRLAHDIARKHYVHGDGDMVFDEGMREAASIRAAVASFRLALRLHRNDDTRRLNPECLARFAAVQSEMGKSQEIGTTLKREIKGLAAKLMAAAADGMDDAAKRELNNLVKAYARIFRDSQMQK